MPNLELNKLKSSIKHGTEVTLNLSSNVTGDSDDATNFQRKLLLGETEVLRLRKVFANSLTGNIKLSNIHLSKIV